MTKLFTETDLIRYVYGETSETENTEIENAIICDSDLNETLNELKLVYEGLNNLMQNPSDRYTNELFKFSTI
jgi:hypothetical protein